MDATGTLDAACSPQRSRSSPRVDSRLGGSLETATGRGVRILARRYILAMRERWKHIGMLATAPVLLVLAVTFAPPVSVDAIEFNGSCFRHRRCVTHKFGLSHECHMYTDEMESSRLSKPTAPPESCAPGDWFLVSSCSYFVGGTVACALHPRRGPAAAINALQFLAEAQSTHRQNTGHYLTETEAREQWSPDGEYKLGVCGGEATTFEPDRYHVVLAGQAAQGGKTDCWALDSTSGLRRLESP